MVCRGLIYQAHILNLKINWRNPKGTNVPGDKLFEEEVLLFRRFSYAQVFFC